MTTMLSKFVLLGAMLLAFSLTASGQSDGAGRTEAIVNATAKTTYVIVGTSAKYGWKATKFTTKHVAKPLVVKGAPAVGKFALRQTGTAVKLSFPVVKKLAITYLKL